MQIRKGFLLIMLITALVLSACVPGVPVTSNNETSMEMDTMDKDDAMMDEDKKDDSMMDDDKKDDSMMDDSHGEDSMDKDDAMMDEDKKDDSMDSAMMGEMPDWFSHQFTNINTGETFSIADLKGKVILVETMATWCSNCLRQQKEVKTLHGLIGERDDFVSFGLDIDLYEDADKLKEYVDRQGFDWTYAISNDLVAREIGNLYGSQFLNPPSTPMLIIDRDGNVHQLPFGIKSAAELQAAVQPFLDS